MAIDILKKWDQNCSEKKCSSVREDFLKFEAEGQQFAKFLRSLEQFTRTVKGQNIFELECFLTHS